MDEKLKPDTDTVLAQWQTCLEMANSVSQRRDTMNNLFVTLNSALSAAVSYVQSKSSVMFLFAGIVICIVWLISIDNYKKLNSAKFQVINELEEHLPAQPFSKEWENLKDKKYKRSTKVEMVLPMLFIFLYVILIFIFWFM